MARDYTRAEVLDIIENEARERHIPRDDFLRFAYIETGGRFDEQVSRGPNSAKGLFQFVPATARAYGIEGRELEAVANTDAAAQLYLDNRRSLVKSHDASGRAYLSGKPEPDGLDMYMAHQQGAAGYRSIQAAIAKGEFERADTRANLLNNVSSRDFKAMTGREYGELSGMSDRELARTFVGYWDAKFDRIRIPEKAIEPIVVQRQPAPVPQPSRPAEAEQGKGIELSQAHALSTRHDAVTYGFGSKDVSTGTIDCSGWVVYMQNATMNEINQQAGREVFSRKDKFSPGMDAAATIVDKSVQRSGVLIEGRQVTRDVLKEGMIIGEDNGEKGWDRGRYKGIDHIVMVVRDPASGALMISQSRGGEGVELTPVDDYLKRKHARGTDLYATDPLAEARSLLQDRGAVRGGERTPPQAPVAAADGVLRRGENGEEVRAMQERLNQLGYRDAEGKTLRADGDFGRRTEEALRDYQRDQGLKVDGVAGPKTLGALRQSEHEPLISDSRHPGHELYKQALDKLDPTAFKNRREVEQAAGTMAFEARVSGLSRIDQVAVSRDGKGLFAIEGQPNDPGHRRIYADKEQAGQQSLERSTQLWQQDVPQPAQSQEQAQQQGMQQETRRMA